MAAFKKSQIPLIDIESLVTSHLDLKVILDLALELSSRTTQAEHGMLFLVDPERKKLWSFTSETEAEPSEKQFSQQAREIFIKMGEGLVGEAAQIGQTINISDFSQDHRLADKIFKITNLEPRNALAIPIKNPAGEVLGVLQLVNKKEGSFNDLDVDYLTRLVTLLGITFEKVLLYREAIEKSQLAEEAIENNIKRLTTSGTPLELTCLELKGSMIIGQKTFSSYFSEFNVRSRDITISELKPAYGNDLLYPGMEVRISFMISQLNCWFDSKIIRSDLHGKKIQIEFPKVIQLNERRRYPRIEPHPEEPVLITFTLESSGNENNSEFSQEVSETINEKVINLSSGGILFATKLGANLLPKAGLLKDLVLEFPNGIEVCATAVIVKTTATECSLEFTQIEDTQRVKISNYVSKRYAEKMNLSAQERKNPN